MIVALLYLPFGNTSSSGLVRIAMLSIAGTPDVLGAAGAAWTRFVGGTQQAGVLSAGVLTLWMVAPLAIAGHVLSRRDL